MKNKKSARVGVERGFGPRHAFNAQEGSEAVPGELPTPPAMHLRIEANSLANVDDQVVDRRRLGGDSWRAGWPKALANDAAKLAVSMLVGGRRCRLGDEGRCRMKMWNSMEAGESAGCGWDKCSGIEMVSPFRVDAAGNHYEAIGTHVEERATR